MIKTGFSTLPFLPFCASLKSTLYCAAILSILTKEMFRFAFFFCKRSMSVAKRQSDHIFYSRLNSFSSEEFKTAFTY